MQESEARVSPATRPARVLGKVLLCAALYATAVGASETATVQVTDAWVRWLPANLPAGGYLTVINSGDHPVRLTGAASDAYASVTLHQSRQKDGVASMAAVESVTIAPHSRLQFESQGYHLMLMQPIKPIKPGDRISMTIQFASGASIPVQFEVRSPGGT